LYRCVHIGKGQVLQLFKVSDVVEKTGKSKTSVYRKISKLKTELKPHKKTLNGVIYYDEEGLKIIAESFGLSHNVDKGGNQCGNADSKALEMAESMIKLLENQLAEKDKQIAQLIKQNDQSQHLLLNEQKEKQLLLDVKDQYENQTFIDRLFGKKVKLDDL